MVGHQSPPTVLVVDDERDLADLFANWLGNPYSVRTAYDGAEALGQLDGAVDVVLLDRRMPELSGDEVLREIRENELDCRVVIVSAVEPDFDVVDMGFDDYLTKPVLKEDLRDAVERMLTRSEYGDTVQELFQAVAAKAALQSEKPETELEHNEEYLELQARIDELQAVADDTVCSFADRDFEAAFRDLDVRGEFAQSDDEPEEPSKTADSRSTPEALVEIFPEPVVVMDADGDVVDGNDALAELLQRPREELLGAHWSSVFEAGERDLFEALRAGMDGRTTIEGEPIRVATSGEDAVAVELSGASIETPDGERVLGVVCDRSSDARLRRQRERLDLVASTVSHDLRNPLSVVTGYVDVTRETGDLSHLEQVSTTLERLNAMLDDAATLARVPTDLDADEAVALERLLPVCWEAVGETDATLRIETSATLYGDEGALSTLFEELLENAVEHGGTAVTVGSLEDGFYVADDGPGIDDPEQMLRPGYSTAEAGTGLGLPIVVELVDAHGWSLSVVESDSGGARFEITGVALESGSEN